MDVADADEDRSLLRKHEKTIMHLLLNDVCLPCNAKFLPPGAPPPPWDQPSATDFSPFRDRASFELADLLFRRAQVAADTINELLNIWAATLPDDQDPPFKNKDD
ncbi:hypothetical protein CPC08DRAFT_769725 [Agrocybe pediades]|nr:hypothetical protein CPC08DRAFT_769725 [Agrocybe pediades]